MGTQIRVAIVEVDVSRWHIDREMCNTTEHSFHCTADMLPSVFIPNPTKAIGRCICRFGGTTRMSFPCELKEILLCGRHSSKLVKTLCLSQSYCWQKKLASNGPGLALHAFLDYPRSKQVSHNVTQCDIDRFSVILFVSLLLPSISG